MVRDVIVDIDERDLVFGNVRGNVPFFNVVWGNLFDHDKTESFLYCNIVVPQIHWGMVKYNENNEFICYIKSEYCPEDRPFRVRLVKYESGKYNTFYTIRGDYGLLAYSYVFNRSYAQPIDACQLLCVDIDGLYLVRFSMCPGEALLDMAYIYSAKSTDLKIDFSDHQASRLLSICVPGNLYRYPTTGVGIIKYVNSVVSYSDIKERLDAQFQADGKMLQRFDFDSETGELDVLFNDEVEVVDEDILDLDELERSFVTDYTDRYVKRNLVIDEADDLDYIELLKDYDDIVNIFFFKGKSTNLIRLSDNVEQGKRFDEYGAPIADDEYAIVTANVEPGTMIMFDDVDENNMNDMPVFIVNNRNEERLYTHLIGQPMSIGSKCYKAAIITQRAIIKYVIKQSRYEDGYGIFKIPQTVGNIRNMLTVVTDKVTGKLMAVVSSKSNIEDVIMERLAHQIFAIYSDSIIPDKNNGWLFGSSDAVLWPDEYPIAMYNN